MANAPGRDDTGGRVHAVIHVEVDGDPVDFGHPNTPAHGNVGLTPGHDAIEIPVGGDDDGPAHVVTIDLTALVDHAGAGGV